MDVDLREAFEQGFGPEPAHRPVSERVEAGRRAVRRRRLTGTVVTVATAALAGWAVVAALGDGPEGTAQVVTDPTAAPTTEAAVPWTDGELARYTDDGELELRDGVTVLQRIDSPLPQDIAQRSVALALERDGQESWSCCSGGADGARPRPSFHPGGAFSHPRRAGSTSRCSSTPTRVRWARPTT